MVPCTPGTLSKTVRRDLSLAMSNAAALPHRAESPCLLFVINVDAAATPMGSCEE